MQPEIRGLLRAAGALALALIFVSVLMTASAQQDVLKQLAAVDSKLDYSSAYVIKLQVDQADQDARTAAANEQAANQIVAKASDGLDSASSDFDDAWNSALPQIRASVKGGKCDLEGHAPDAPDQAQRGQIISLLQGCPAGARIVAGGSEDGLAPLYHRMMQAQAQAAAAKQRLARAQDVSKALKEQDVKARQVRNSFDATSKLRSSWLLGGNMLIDFPPELLQILLSFVSGSFGALLLTLVLIVYPNSQFTVSSNGGYGARTLLGGLIALCVYVVLNGGSAVLGNTTPTSSGGNNYMTFCAIGILAGMFSDRVAAWLSARADAFFRNPGNAGAANVPGSTGSSAGGGGAAGGVSP